MESTRDIPTAVESLLAGQTKIERRSLLKLLLDASAESTLKRLIKETAKFCPGLKGKGGVHETFFNDSVVTKKEMKGRC